MPMDKTIVTTVASPSGIAATAKDTATIKLSSTTSSAKLLPRISLKAKINTQIPKTI